MKIHQLELAAAIQSLHSNVDGLSEQEADRRLREFGPNRMGRVRGTPLLVRFIREFTHFFALILWLAVGLAFFAEWNEPNTGMATLGFAILGVILINGVFSFGQEFRAERTMESLRKLLPLEVKVSRGGKVRQASVEVLVPGDIVLLDDGDDVPADCRLIEAFAVRVNNATVTGESVPQARDERPCAVDDFVDARNILLAGTSVVAGQAKAVVFATGMHTEFGKIAHFAQSSRERLSPLQQEIARLSRLVAIISLALGVVFFLVGQHVGLTFWQNLLFAIGIIVANVPEGLLPTVSLSLAMASQRMARKNVLIRHLPSVETLGATTVICTDKTGTLTKNLMEVKKLFVSGGLYVAGESAPLAELSKIHRPFFEAAFFCHTLKNVEQHGRPAVVGDPMEVALVAMARPFLDSPNYPRVDEVPFDSDRKRLSLLHRTSRGLVLFTKGALETVLPLCSRVHMNGGTPVLGEQTRKEFLLAQEQMAGEGLRVLAIAERAVPTNHDREHLEEELTLLGLVGMEDPPRLEVPDAIARCRQAGIKVIMVTGDHPQTGQAVARQIGLFQGNSPSLITGEMLRRMSPAELQLALDSPDILFARVAADQKMSIVNALKSKGHIVAVTGDGVNDAPALRQAHIGIAMGKTGTDVSREAADMILLDDNFASIVAAIEEGRAVFANIRKFLTYILTSNVPELIPYLAFVLFKVPLALTIIQILAVDLGTDMLPALALGTEPPEPGIMQKPPRSAKDRLVDWPLLARAYLFLGMLEAGAAMIAFFFVLHAGGWHYGQQMAFDDPLYLQATTACLTAVILMQVANVFQCRSEQLSILSFGLFSNRLIVTGVIFELILITLIDCTPAGNNLFGTAPIDGRILLMIIPFALIMLIFEEFRKRLKLMGERAKR